MQPAPNSYAPQADIVNHIKSNHPKVATTKFGLDKSDILDSRWGRKAAQETPGPGSYGRWSDFSKDVKWVIYKSGYLILGKESPPIFLLSHTKQNAQVNHSKNLPN